MDKRIDTFSLLIKKTEIKQRWYYISDDKGIAIRGAYYSRIMEIKNRK